MRCFIDMDGVLADYYGGICRAFRAPMDPPAWPYRCRLGDWDFFVGHPLHLNNEQVAPVMNRDFYANLDLLPDARELMKCCEERFGSEVFFLSSPWDTPGCDQGKREWVKKHFPDYSKKTLIGSCKEACAHPKAVLFDDSPKNCESFIRAGGQAILIPRPWNMRHNVCDLATGRMLNVAPEVFW